MAFRLPELVRILSGKRATSPGSPFGMFRVFINKRSVLAFAAVTDGSETVCVCWPEFDLNAEYTPDRIAAAVRAEFWEPDDFVSRVDRVDHEYMMTLFRRG